jgi:hypothetical protein
LLVILCLNAFLGLLVHQVLQHRRAVLCLLDLGGTVIFEQGSSAQRSDLQAVKNQLLFGSPCAVRLQGSSAQPQNLGVLPSLVDLERLTLVGTDVNDRCLSSLARLRGLTFLELVETRVSDTGLEQLRRALPFCQISRRSAPSQADTVKWPTDFRREHLCSFLGVAGRHQDRDIDAESELIFGN